MGSRNVERDKPSIDEQEPLARWVVSFADWQISAFCTGCGHVGRLEPEVLIKKLKNPRARIGDVRARLCCERCGLRVFTLKPVFAGKRRD